MRHTLFALALAAATSSPALALQEPVTCGVVDRQGRLEIEGRGYGVLGRDPLGHATIYRLTPTSAAFTTGAWVDDAAADPALRQARLNVHFYLQSGVQAQGLQLILGPVAPAASAQFAAEMTAAAEGVSVDEAMARIGPPDAVWARLAVLGEPVAGFAAVPVENGSVTIMTGQAGFVGQSGVRYQATPEVAEALVAAANHTGNVVLEVMELPEDATPPYTDPGPDQQPLLTAYFDAAELSAAVNSAPRMRDFMTEQFHLNCRDITRPQ